MTVHLLEVAVFLSLLAFLPVVTLTGLRPATLFLCPLGGALLGAWAAELELSIGGSFLTVLLIVAVGVNAATVAYRWWNRAVSHRSLGLTVGQGSLLVSDAPLTQSPGWMALTLVAIAAAVLWPLQALRVPTIGFDANMVWLLHAILIYGGHSSMASGIHNPVFSSVHAEYPPLVPASSAVGFIMNNGIDLQVGVATTAMLNACALGILGSGIAEISGAAVSVWRRLIVLVAAAAICLIGFGIAGQFAVDGFADLTWAAPAAAAVVFGLVLPRSAQRLGVAWICLTVAGLTKNEGLIAALIIAALISLRYVNPDSRSELLTWVRRGLVAAILALPALTWSGLMEHYHVSSRFFHAVRGEPPLERVGPTLSATAHYLQVLPVALIVLFLGGVLLRSPRRRAGLAHPIWLWTVAVTNLLALVGTYVFGAFEIHWWLSSSVNRTTIFTQLILYTDIGIWAAIAALPRPIPADRRPSSAPEETGRQVVGSVANR